MSQNLSPSMLDAPQIIKRVYDEANDAVRVEVASGTSFDISLSAAAGDNVLVGGTEDGTTSGTQHMVTVDSDKNLHTLNMGQLVPKIFDSIVATYPTATQEVYAYKTGGISGTTVATLTVNYTDSTKTVFSNVART